MPTTRVEIEQVEGNKWVAELELGGMQAKRHHLVGATFGEIITEISNTYYEANPPVGLEPPTQPQDDLDERLAELEAEAEGGVRGELSAPSAGEVQTPQTPEELAEGEDPALGAAIDAALAPEPEAEADSLNEGPLHVD